ncbi:MAG: DNA polymerase I, partial [Gammaproteobacteria bacterium]|nr:DNA polymerase I [Gammaproteobacteria bacterium]
LYTRWEMKSFLRQLNGRAPSSAQSNRKTENDEQENETPIEKRPVNGNYTTIFTQNEFDTWLGKLKKAKQFAFDTETTSIDYMQAEIVGVSFAVKNGEAAYVPLAHDYEGAPKQLSRNKVLAALKSLLEDQAVKKIGHHLKYDAHVLQHYDVRLRGIEYDTMMESFVWNSTATRHDLDSVAEQYLGLQTIKFEDVAGKGKGQKTFNEVELEIAAPYAAEDADITLRVHESLWPNFEKTPSLKTIYQNVEKPLIPVLQDMEHRGVLIDSDLLAVQSGEIENKLNTLEQKAFEEAGREFNISSTKQLGEILFDQMGLPIIRKTPKGAPSTAEDVLQELAGAYTLPQLILDYRSLSKLKSTYTDKLPKQVNPKTGRVHTSYHQAVAATGRLSSSDPNLQNIPIRTPEGRRIREAFIAPKGYKILAADYSQIELRIMAHLSGDQGLLNVFKEDRDVHQATAAEVFGLPLDKVSKEERRSAKAINFGLMYGMSAFGLAKQLNISRGAAQDYIDIYFDRYPGVKNYMDRTREQAKNDGYVETVFGRRLYLQDIRSSNHQRRQYAERAAINAPMQGTNADIIKLAMIDIFKWIADKHMPLNMIMQVHDELVFEVKESDIDTCSEMIVEKMISAAELSIPLKVEAGVGDNWQEAH